MKKLIFTFLVLTACSAGFAAKSLEEDRPLSMIGSVVTAYMTDGGVISGTLISQDETGIVLRLSSGKWYFYPQARLNVIGQQ